MEKQGIITGVGNEITPEIDAVINGFIVGKNTILKGLELNGNILSAGTCILCGYRGTLENSQTVDGNYVYGKFVIGVNETDSFSIFTSSNSTEPTDGIINPTSITSAGTYYLRLYANGASQVDIERYPKQAYISERARHLIAGGIIYSTATTDTAPINDNSKRVANTEYVHKQIVAEIDEGTYVESVTHEFHTVLGGTGNVTFHYDLKRRAKYVYGTIRIETHAASRIIAQSGTLLDTLPTKFRPKNNTTITFGTYVYFGSSADGTSDETYDYNATISTDGTIKTSNYWGDIPNNKASFQFGYEIIKEN